MLQLFLFCPAASRIAGKRARDWRIITESPRSPGRSFPLKCKWSPRQRDQSSFFDWSELMGWFFIHGNLGWKAAIFFVCFPMLICIVRGNDSFRLVGPHN